MEFKEIKSQEELDKVLTEFHEKKLKETELAKAKEVELAAQKTAQEEVEKLKIQLEIEKGINNRWGEYFSNKKEVVGKDKKTKFVSIYNKKEVK